MFSIKWRGGLAIHGDIAGSKNKWMLVIGGMNMDLLQKGNMGSCMNGYCRVNGVRVGDVDKVGEG